MLVETNWQGKMAFTAGGDDGITFNMDASADVGGQGKGVTPMTALLGALSGCMSMDITAMLRKYVESNQITNMRMEADGTQNEQHPRYFTDVTITFYVEGDVPGKRVWSAMRKSEQTYCPVRNSMKANVTLKLILNGQEVPEP